MRPPRTVTAVAGTNIALVKYWGKRDVRAQPARDRAACR